ncbi:response regulator transcription factor [Paenibacillus aceris]|uniref:Two-component system response regulator YesN n=1 Tax=Paenibacillus aceris TaxID=869555 RepID=A0ABS4I3H8_9BACL|nr:response regulator [Paenibacillus aceris]MBP1965478.1 two-component system response regulator YesN [Paenibacillus aceris]NHW33472.1 response regulator [Paenibacillus aceris]
MWKLMIADDEPRIRNGLCKTLPWADMGIEVVAEAENGKEALEIAASACPDLMFVDINMPFMNGLELIEKLQIQNPNCLVIVISGHDEFAYAQQAVRLNAFDYLLKPVQKTELGAAVNKAIDVLMKDRVEQKHTQWMNHKLEFNALTMREEFFSKWITGKLTKEQFEEEWLFFQPQFHGKISMLLLKPLGKITANVQNKIWDPPLLEFAIKNILTEMLPQLPVSVIFSVEKGRIAALSQISDLASIRAIYQEFERVVITHLGVSMLLSHTVVEQLEDVPRHYEELHQELLRESALTPIVMMTKKYLETYYYKEDLSLSEVAEQMNVNATYLSKLLKRDLGKSFVDCLTDIRIKKAIQYLNDPTSKIYEIAQKVGYQSQHYFSHTFKKMTGVSPLEYRKRGDY